MKKKSKEESKEEFEDVYKRMNLQTEQDRQYFIGLGSLPTHNEDEKAKPVFIRADILSSETRKM